MKIGFKTIYRWLYQKIIAKGNVNRLRRKGKSLKPKETRGKFNIGKSIKDRPKEVRKRETIGHWELDTVVSSRGKSKACLSTFVERKSRFLIAQVMENRKSSTLRETIGHWELDTVVSSRGKSKACLSTFVERKSRFLIAQVMENRKSSTFNFHCFTAFKDIPCDLIKTFTVDRGKEFARYVDIENTLNIDVYFADAYASWQRGTNENTNGVDRGKEFARYVDIENTLNIDVYFADAYASWQRGTNENTNGLLREFYPKKFDFSSISQQELDHIVTVITISQQELDHIVTVINNRPRKCLGYKTPAEVFNAT